MLNMNDGIQLAAVQLIKDNFSKRHEPVIEPAKEVAGSRYAWRLKFGRIDSLEGAILGVAADISQITDAPAGLRRKSLSFLGGIRKIGC